MGVKTMQQYHSEGKTPEILFWVGCAGSFDDRAQKVTAAFAQILTENNIQFAILGKEENCTGDPARRAGNEFVFQMLAAQNIEVLNMYNVKKIVTTCPHCYNIIKNEYPELGGSYEVLHHSQFLSQLISENRISIPKSTTKKITYHDSCYLGRANGEYNAPRNVLKALKQDILEMERTKSKGFCCGAGGAQMFKEDENGNKRINIERSEEAIETGADIIAVNCPFCLTMLKDGVVATGKQEHVMILDLSELILNN